MMPAVRDALTKGNAVHLRLLHTLYRSRPVPFVYWSAVHRVVKRLVSVGDPLFSEPPSVHGGVLRDPRLQDLLRHDALGAWSLDLASGRFVGTESLARLLQWEAALDALLPQRSWPRRALTELLLPADGVGELSLLMPTLVRMTQAGGTVALIAPPYLPYAPAWQAAGVELAALQIVDATPRDGTPQFALPLSWLAPGDYLIEVLCANANGAVKERVAFTVTG